MSARAAHKGGLHVSAVEKDPRTYEHVDPEVVGNQRIIVVSDQAGRSNIMARFRQIGLEVDPKDPGVAPPGDRQGARGRGLCLRRRRRLVRVAGAPRAAHRARLLRLAERVLLSVASMPAASSSRCPRRREARRRRQPRHGSGRRQRSGERARCCPAKGADTGLSRAAGHAAGRLQGPHPRRVRGNGCDDPR